MKLVPMVRKLRIWVEGEQLRRSQGFVVISHSLAIAERLFDERRVEIPRHPYSQLPSSPILEPILSLPTQPTSLAPIVIGFPEGPLFRPTTPQPFLFPQDFVQAFRPLNPTTLTLTAEGHLIFHDTQGPIGIIFPWTPPLALQRAAQRLLEKEEER